MTQDELVEKDYWEKRWAGFPLPSVQNPVYDVRNLLESLLPQTPEFSLIEIGCAPGKWMAYFSREYGYRVSGIEYAEAAATTTRRNMEMLAIDAEIMNQDFLAGSLPPGGYDVVFSSGFIEHFRDLSSVTERICTLSRRYVVTIVPNVYGLNGFISKTLRPGVHAGHNPIDVQLLEKLHADCGMNTVFCDYIGGGRLIMLATKNSFFEKHKWCARAVNTPVRLFNWLSSAMGRWVHWTPRSRFLSDSLMYVGQKGVSESCAE